MGSKSRTWLAAMATCSGLCFGTAAFAQPANDTCASPQALSVNQIFYGNNATATSTGDGPAATCQASSNKGVWFTFTPAVSGNYQFNSCGTRFDSVLQVYTTTDCTTFTAVGCDDDTCAGVPGREGTGSGLASIINSIALTGGQQYYVRLSAFGTAPAGGIYQIGVFDLSANGACCTNAGVCTVVAAASCATSGTGTSYFMGAGTSCGPTTCTGACCNGTSCTDTNPGTACSGTGISWGGFQTGCGTYTCPTGACCAQAGTCTLTGPTGCASGSTYQGTGTVCSPNPCPQPPANDLCTAPQVIPATALPVNVSATGTLLGAGPTTNITPAVCASSARDVFYSFTPVDSASYTITTCNSVTGTLDTVVSVHTACPADGSTSIACNDDSCTGGAGPSTISAFPLDAGITYIIRVARFSTGAGGPFRLDITTGAFGACCDTAAGTCQLQSQSACAGTFQGDGSLCSPNPCTGACCNDTTGACTATGSANCPSGSTFQGTGTLCSPNPCPQPPPPANDECSAAINVVVNDPPINGNNFNSTQSQTASCTGSTEDVWYSFNAATTGVFTATADSDVGTLISVSAFDACGGTELACVGALNDPTVLNITVNTPGTIFLRVATFTTETNFTLQVTQQISGACCNATTGACTTVVGGAGNCTGNYQGDGSSCSPSPCPANGACCDANGACTLVITGTCSGSYQGDGSVCSPNPCPPPANDECSAAITISTGTTVGNNTSATTGGFDIHSCQATANKGVWYDFTAVTAGNYQIDTEGSVQTDTVVSVFDACGGTELACDDDSGTGLLSNLVISLAANQNVKILVSSFGSAPAGGQFNLNINNVTAGACCDDLTGACTTVVSPATCATGTTYQGDNTTCSPSPCAASGACCNDTTGSCLVRIQAQCTSGSTYQGDGSVCSPNPCPQPPPPANDDCAMAVALTVNTPYSNNNTQATGDGTEGPGGACYTTSPDHFSKAVWFTFTAPTTNSYEVTACGTNFDTVLSVFEGDCNAFGTEIGCDDDTCDGVTPVGSTLASVIAAVPMTQGQTYLIRLAVWTTGGAGGDYTIAVNGQAATNNVCCRGATCSLTSMAGCTATGTAGAQFNSGSSTCNVGSTTTPCCYADYNKVGGIGIQDIFDFLNDWFAGSNFADTGSDGTTAPDIQSIFDFLNAWFAGGC